ncbi:MAG: aminopeptidase [Candidatus ainarchaeum sp.]|nr:aminopeptidase [Candidatus ainarchaeum sp.]
MIEINDYKKLSKFNVLSFNSIKKIEKIYSITKKNNILIYCDLGKRGLNASARMGKTFYKYFKSKGNNISIFVDNYSEKLVFAPKKFNEAAFSLKKNDLLILVGSGMTLYFHKKGKRVDKNILINKLGIKMVSTNGLISLKKEKINVFFKAFNHDEKKLIKLNKKLVSFFEKSKKAIVSCPKGTNFSVLLGKRRVISNDGSLKDFSTNYPVGEVYTAPLENSANGIAFVKSAKVLGKTILLKKPVKMEFQNGLLVNNDVPNLKKGLKKLELFNKKKGVKNWRKAPYTIAEFAIGTNSKSKLIGLMINDEKAFGTIHFAIGANSHFGGKTKCNGHMDYVIEKPTLFLDNKKLIDNGKFLI